MNRMTLAALLLLSGCAATPPVVGSARGGIIDVALHQPNEKILAAADAHCRRFGRQARITSVQAPAVTEVLFECA